jgi:hypothetical protein
MIKNQKVPNRSVFASLAFRRDKFHWGGFVEHLQRKNHKLLHEPGGTMEMETDPTPFGWEIINGPAYSTPADDLSNVFTWWNHNRDSEYLPQRRKGRKKIKLSDLAFLRRRSGHARREIIPVFAG